MNRSILIVICDFLLVSLVAFTTVDVNKLSDQGAREVKLEMATNRVDGAKDLAAVMQQALADERRNRDRLLGELATTRDTLTRQQSLLGERDKQVKDVRQELADLEKQLQASQQELAARDQRLQASQQELAERDKKVQAFQQELTARQQQGTQLAQQQAALQAQLAAAQAGLTNLTQQLHDNTVQSIISGERLAAFEDLVSKQAVLQSSNILQQLAALAKTNEAVLAERQRLGAQLAMAETEKRFAAEQVSRMQDEVKIEREEKARLAEGVKELAAKSGDIAREVRDSRGLVPNSIFHEFVTNRVQARFAAVRSVLFGESSKTKESQTVLVADGSGIYALCHVHDTPLVLWEPGTDWEALTGTLNRNAASCPIRSVSFCLADPRVMLIPVNAEEATRLGCKVYRVSADPYKFQDAVLIGTREDYYGECRFQIDLSTPDYVKLDRSFLKGLIGKFNPSRGDLVFSRTGEVLGVMANSSYCLMLRSFSYEATFQFGDDVRAQHTGATLSALYSHLLTMPFKLQ
jgi:peptidoglycan hydrolase CwlO-like protein